MGRGLSTFRQRDVTAAVKAVIAAGIVVRGVEIDKTGNIRITVATEADKVRSQPTALTEDATSLIG
jgi:hypothetical protein